jgi:hypothetical protein
MNTQTALLIIALLLIAFLASNCFFAEAMKKGWKIGGTLQTADKAVAFADVLVKALSPLFPVVFTNITEKIIGYAKTAVAAAEQLYSAGNLQGEQRKQYAINFITSALKQENCEITPELQQLIDTAVEASVSLVKSPDK